MSNRQGIPLPAVTVCPLDRFDVNRLEQLWRQTIDDNAQQQKPPDPTEQYYQLAGVLPVDELWHKIAYPTPADLFPMVISLFSFPIFVIWNREATGRYSIPPLLITRSVLPIELH